MAEWTTPKDDWGATDAVPHTELNKIGENLQWLRDTMVITGSTCGRSMSPTSETTRDICMITVPDGYTLKLKHWRFCFPNNEDDIRLQVEGDIHGGANQYDKTSAAEYDDSELDETVYTASGSSEDIVIKVTVHNINNYLTRTVSGGWWLLFVLES